MDVPIHVPSNDVSSRLGADLDTHEIVICVSRSDRCPYPCRSSARTISWVSQIFSQIFARRKSCGMHDSQGFGLCHRPAASRFKT
jgi:hypothetical protein